MTHELKTHTQVFDQIKGGMKNFEFRKNDRDFQTGDKVILKEYLPNLMQYTGEEITAIIGFVLRGPDFGVPEGYCCFSLLNIKRT
jgi:hypothetical protein